MNQSTLDYLKILLQPGEFTCFTREATGTEVRSAPKQGDVFVAVNALHPTQDLAPSQPWHASGRPRRADANVVSYRNFLLELDEGSLEEQYKLVTDRLPVSAITFSGAKSLHFLISLDTPLPDAAAYKLTAARLLKLVPEADPSCRNASRLTRLPGARRPDTGVEQKLMYLGERVKWEQLDALLPVMEQRTYRERTPDEVRSYVSPLLLWASQNPDEVMREHNIKGRNSFFYWLHCRMKDINLEPQKQEHYVLTAWGNLSDKNNFPLMEAYLAARIRND